MTALAPRPTRPPGPDLLAPISWKAPLVYGAASVLALVGFAAFTSPAARTRFTVGVPGDAITIEPFTVPSQGAALAGGLIMAALAAYCAWATGRRLRIGMWLPLVFGAVFVLAFLTWVLADGALAVPVTGLLGSALFLSIPLIFGSMAGLVCEHAGVINVAIEGQLLAGAFLAATVATGTGSPYLGLAAAPIAGAVVGMVLALFAVRYWVDHIIVGVVLNVLVAGVTSYLFSTVLSHDAATWNTPGRLPTLPIPVLSSIPVIGPVLFRHNAIVYLMYAVVAALQIWLFRSRWGLRMRACGEHPRAADVAGIRVNATRIRATILGGAIAGLGGAFFTVAQGLAFGKDMSAGRGFIALAAMILGRWNPRGALAAALLFGFADALQALLSPAGTPIPGQILLMTPYVVTILAVAGFVGRVAPPAAEGKPYGEAQ
jgi:simple sugar transport system permease protein